MRAHIHSTPRVLAESMPIHVLYQETLGKLHEKYNLPVLHRALTLQDTLQFIIAAEALSVEDLKKAMDDFSDNIAYIENNMPLKQLRTGLAKSKLRILINKATYARDTLKSVYARVTSATQE